MRIGTGFDVHRLTTGRPLWLAGVEIPHEFGLEGHSDADVVLHAIMDAVLGALALGDIGQHFPNTDAKYKGADSGKLTQHVVDLMSKMKYQIGNVDVMLLAERPKISPYLPQMRERVAELLKCSIQQVSIKATTMEGLGFVGTEQGMAAQVVVLLVPQA